MSSTEFTFEQKQAVVQDSLISLINDEVSSPIVRFLKPEERTMSEEDLQLLYRIFNGFVYITHHSKKSKKTEFVVRLGKNFEDTPFGYVDLEPKVINGLKAWIRGASKALENHFINKYDGVFLGRLRFDLLTQDLQTFFIPNFRLETNIILYKDIVSANSSHYLDLPEFDPNRISYKEFVEEEWSDLQVEIEFRNRTQT